MLCKHASHWLDNRDLARVSGPEYQPFRHRVLAENLSDIFETAGEIS